MKIIISPAKKMKIDNDTFECKDMPCFLDKTMQIKNKLYTLNYTELKKIWKCNDNIAMQNYQRIQNMNVYQNLTPAIFAYEGIQYQHVSANIYTYEQLNFLQEKLRILSGFYGFLKPFDGIVNYRLEMQAKLSVENHKDLYSFWNDNLAKKIIDETDTVLNLASKEYSKAVVPYLDKKTNVLTCVFAENINDKLVEKATMCKIARGEMVKFVIENNINNIYDVQNFDYLNYKFSKENSTNNNYVFIKENNYVRS